MKKIKKKKKPGWHTSKGGDWSRAQLNWEWD